MKTYRLLPLLALLALPGFAADIAFTLMPPTGPVTAGGPVRVDQVVGRVDKADMREPLREIANKSPLCPIVLLSQQTEIIPHCQESFKQRCGVIDAVEHDVRIGQPKRAREERTFLAAYAVVDFISPVTKHKAIAQELTLNGSDSPCNPRIVGW